jgi:hypothetical protein
MLKPIVLRVSKRVSDWQLGQQLSEDQLKSFIYGYCRHAVKYLSAHGYSPRIQFVDNYCQPGAFEWQDDQASLRIELLSSYLTPSTLKTKSLNYLSGASDCPKW